MSTSLNVSRFNLQTTMQAEKKKNKPSGWIRRTTPEEREKLRSESRETKEIRGFDLFREIFEERSYDEILEMVKDSRRNRKSAINYVPSEDEWDDDEEEDWCKSIYSDI